MLIIYKTLMERVAQKAKSSCNSRMPLSFPLLLLCGCAPMATFQFYNQASDTFANENCLDLCAGAQINCINDCAASVYYMNALQNDTNASVTGMIYE